jgi:hypothetical protein
MLGRPPRCGATTDTRQCSGRIYASAVASLTCFRRRYPARDWVDISKKNASVQNRGNARVAMLTHSARDDILGNRRRSAQFLIGAATAG